MFNEFMSGQIVETVLQGEISNLIFKCLVVIHHIIADGKMDKIRLGSRWEKTPVFSQFRLTQVI